MASNTLDIGRRGFNTLSFLGIFEIKVLVGRNRLKCGKSECRGWMNDDGYDVWSQTQNCLKDVTSKEVMLVDKLPWYGLFVENLPSMLNQSITDLKKLAPVNGRLVVLIKAKCGCPYAKIEAWSSEDSRTMHETASIKERIKSGEDAACYICKKNYADISGIKQLPCSHFFHKECIDESLKIDAMCPLCDEWEHSWDDSWKEDWNKGLEDSWEDVGDESWGDGGDDSQGDDLDDDFVMV